MYHEARCCVLFVFGTSSSSSSPDLHFRLQIPNYVLNIKTEQNPSSILLQLSFISHLVWKSSDCRWEKVWKSSPFNLFVFWQSTTRWCSFARHLFSLLPNFSSNIRGNNNTCSNLSSWAVHRLLIIACYFPSHGLNGPHYEPIQWRVKERYLKNEQSMFKSDSTPWCKLESKFCSSLSHRRRSPKLKADFIMILNRSGNVGPNFWTPAKFVSVAPNIEEDRGAGAGWHLALITTVFRLVPEPDGRKSHDTTSAVGYNRLIELVSSGFMVDNGIPENKITKWRISYVSENLAQGRQLLSIVPRSLLNTVKLSRLLIALLQLLLLAQWLEVVMQRHVPHAVKVKDMVITAFTPIIQNDCLKQTFQLFTPF